MNIGRSALRTATLALALFAVPAVSYAQPAASVPNYMPYQGLLTNAAGDPYEGAVTLTFRLYDTANAPQPLWTETIPNVPVSRGVFSVHLGQSNPVVDLIRSGTPRYLGVAVNQDPEATPRQRVNSVPYSLLSNDSVLLGGEPPDVYVTVDGLAQEFGDRQVVNEERVIELIREHGGEGGGGGLSADEVNDLITARGYLSRDAIIALIAEVGAGGGDPEVLQQLIEERVQEVVVNQIDRLVEERVEAIIDARVEVVVERVIDARLADAVAAAVDAALDARLGDAIAAAIAAAVDAFQGQIDALGDQIVALQAQIDALQAQVDALQAGGAGGGADKGYILGISADSTDGSISVGGQTGARGATEMCRTTFADEANAHLCGVDEVGYALATGNYNRNPPQAFSGVATWTIAQALDSQFAGSFRGTCQNLMYHSGDAARGTRLTVTLNGESDGGGGGLTGHYFNVQQNVACNNAMPVLCCR